MLNGKRFPLTESNTFGMKMLTGRIAQRIFLGLCIFMPNLFGTVITSGTITPHFGGGGFNLSGSDFNVSGGFDGVGWHLGTCSGSLGCPVGLVTSPEGISIGSGFVGGSATIDGVTFDVTYGDILAATTSVLQATGPQFVLTGPGDYVVPFSLTGKLCGVGGILAPGSVTPDSSGVFPCAVDLPDLTGSGEVTFTAIPVSGFQGQPGLRTVDVTYTFFVPEPSSIVLVGNTLILLAIRKCKWC